MFSLRIIDEAHKVGEPVSYQTDALFKLQDCATILITATPFKNSVRDLRAPATYYVYARKLIGREKDRTGLTLSDFSKYLEI